MTAQVWTQMRRILLGYGPVAMAGLLTVLTLLWGPPRPPADVLPTAGQPASTPPGALSPAPLPPWEGAPTCAADPVGDAEVTPDPAGDPGLTAPAGADVRTLCAAYGDGLQVVVTVDGSLVLPAGVIAGTNLRLPLEVDADEDGPELSLLLEEVEGRVRAAVLDERTFTHPPGCRAAPSWSANELALFNIPAACLGHPAAIAITQGRLDSYDPATYSSTSDALPDLTVARSP